MKKLFLILILFISVPSIAGTTLKRFDFTERMSNCHRMKNIIAGSTSEGVNNNKLDMSGFITYCLGSTFNPTATSNIVGFRTMCPSTILDQGECRFSLNTAPLGAIQDVKAMGLTHNGTAKYTCSGGNWQLNSSTCSPNISLCSSSEKRWGNCGTEIPEMREGQQIRIESNLNDTHFGYIDVRCNSGTISYMDSSCQEYSCPDNFQMSWNSNSGVAGSSSLKQVNCSGVIEKETGRAAYFKEDNRYFDNENIAYESADIVIGEAYFRCDKGIWKPIAGSCQRLSQSTYPKLKCYPKNIKLGDIKKKTVYYCEKGF